jgi:hypothetical protein
VETVDYWGEVGYTLSIALDNTKGVHISYYNDSSDNLKYAYKPSDGSWYTETVDFLGNVGQYTSIAVDSIYGVHISYYDSTNHNLKYAFKSSEGDWSNYTVDSGEYAGHYTSIAVHPCTICTARFRILAAHRCNSDSSPHGYCVSSEKEEGAVALIMA